MTAVTDNRLSTAIVSAGDHVRLVCQGLLVPEVIFARYGEAYDVAVREGHRRLLVDLLAVTGPSPTVGERYQYGVRAADMRRDRAEYVRAAVVSSRGLFDPGRFFELVATNRGAPIKVFTDLDEAVRWLMQLDA